MEPERKIEKLLREFAKKRREQAGDAVELRPAARQRLQNEVRRRSEKTGSSGFFSSLFSLSRPKLAFGFCVLALVCAGAWLLLPVRPHEKSPETLAALSSRKIANVPVSEETKSLPAPLPKAPEMPASAAAPVLQTPAPAAPEPAPAPEVAAAPPVGVVTASAANEAGAPPALDERMLNHQVATAAGEPLAANKPADFAGAADRSAANAKGGATADSSFAQNGVAQVIAPASATPMSSTASTNLLLGVNQSPSPVIAAAGALDKDTRRRMITPAAANAEKYTVYAFKSNAVEAPTTLAFKASPPTGGVAFDTLVNQNGALASQRFYRLDLPAARERSVLGGRSPAAILTSFSVEQNGSQLRVLDADGSVYTGNVLVVRDEKKLDDALAATLKTEAAAANATETKSAPKAEPPSPAQNYFVVTGTNRDLKQLVTFSGNFIPLTNGEPLGTNRFLSGAAGMGGSMPNGPTPLLLNSRIAGKAVLGSGKEIDINAAPARQ